MHGYEVTETGIAVEIRPPIEEVLEFC